MHTMNQNQSDKDRIQESEDKSRTTTGQGGSHNTSRLEDAMEETE